MSTIEHGMLRGPIRTPINAHQDAPNSIHNDGVAGSLGFRGGTVAGSVHMDQFPPVLVDAFGPAWFETGSLSLQFRNATTSGEPVIAMVGQPDAEALSAGAVQVPARMETPDGTLVAEGTASIGDHGLSTHLESIDLRGSDPSELRMFPHLEVGQEIVSYDETIDAGAAVGTAGSRLITEPLAWYSGLSPWGGPVASPSRAVSLLWRRTSAELTRSTGGAVGLFGSIEVRHHGGPLLADHTYRVSSRVAAIGASPKTEYVWFDSDAHEPDGGERVASMRMQLRWMKASSSLYADEAV
jgi:hypothetical protein